MGDGSAGATAVAPAPGRGAIINTGSQAILWVSVPIEVMTEKAGSKKVYVSARKVQWALGDPHEAESQQLSASFFREVAR